MSWQVPENSVRRQLWYSRRNVSFVLFSPRAAGLPNYSSLASFWPPYSPNSHLKVYSLLHFIFSLDSRKIFLWNLGGYDKDENFSF